MTTNLSIIVPFYNCAHYFRQCLDSILTQEHLSFELILVDDGSTDGSEVAASEYAARDKRIVLFRQQNKGIPFARNKGLELAKGEYFLFIDADDYIAPNTLHKLYQEAKKNNLDVLQTTINLLFADGKIKKKRFHSYTSALSGISYFMHMTSRRSMSVAPYVNLVKTAFLQEIGLRFDERLIRCQDFEFYTKVMMLAGRIMNIDIPYYYFRVNSDTAQKHARNKTTLLFSYYKIIVDNFLSFAKQQRLPHGTTKRLMWLVCSHVRRYPFSQVAKLPLKDYSYWNNFIRKNIFTNKGWMRPYAWKRFLLTFNFCKKWLSIH